MLKSQIKMHTHAQESDYPSVVEIFKISGI